MIQSTSIDKLVHNADQALRTIFGATTAMRANPAAGTPETELSESERSLSGGLMRVNHVGEVCAQALYQGQALTAKSDKVRESLEQAAREETDHLAWCEQRLGELGESKSLLNPLWYTGSFVMGALSGLAGDKWNLGFLAETEKQVERHLDGHLGKLPEQDLKSRAIVKQMREDEANHADMAMRGGAQELPWPIPKIMNRVSRIMTKTAFWI